MKALIVDDHMLFGEGLKMLLRAAIPEFEARCCARGSEALSLARETNFDLVLLDWKLGTQPSGAELVSALKSVAPMARVVVISGESSAMAVRQAIDAGALGFVPKESSPELLVDALSISAHGGFYLPTAVLGAPLPPWALLSTPTRSAAAAEGVPAAMAGMKSIAQAFPELTPRRVQVLDHVARGMSNKQIAKLLSIDEDTVKQHLNKIYAQLGVKSRTEAVYLMARCGVRFA